MFTKKNELQGVIFLQDFPYFATSPSQAPGCFGCTEIGQPDQPIGVTVHSYCVDESFENLLQRYVGEDDRRVAVDDEKTQFFLNIQYFFVI